MSHFTYPPRNTQSIDSRARAVKSVENLRNYEQIIDARTRFALYAGIVGIAVSGYMAYCAEGFGVEVILNLGIILCAVTLVLRYRFIANRALRDLLAVQKLPSLELRDYSASHRYYMTLVAHLPERSGGYVYVIQDASISGYYKIGRTTNPKNRMIDFGVKLPFRISIVHIVAAYNSSVLEREMHERYADQRVSGEWFNLTESQLRDLINVLDYKAAYDIVLEITHE